MRLRNWVLMEGATDGTGGAAGAGAGAGDKGAGAGASAGAGAGAGTGGAPAAFDWKTSGLADADMALVNERQWKDLPALVGSYRNLEKLQGVPAERIVKLPGADAKPEEWAPVWDRLGRPKDAKDYALPVPEGDKGEFAATAAGWFHEAGLPIKAAQTIAGKWNEFAAAQQKAHTEAVKARDVKETAELRAAWGPQFDAHSALVDKAAATFGMSAEQLQALKATMGPAGAMKFMHAIGSKLGVEGDFVAGDGKGGTGGSLTPEQAQTQINALRADKLFVQRYNSSDLAVRKEARDEMKKLHKQAYPGDTLLE